MRCRSSRLLGLLIGAAIVGVGGCGSPAGAEKLYASPWRTERGMVFILPGVEGESPVNREIREGLYRGGVPYALVIHRWGFPVPGVGVVINQTNEQGNREAGAELAARIAAYQRGRPGRPVFLVGHSGGAGVAVFALEALDGAPGGEPVEGAILLSASLSADYDLTKALRMTRRGVASFHNPDDRILLQAGTALMGNIDGGRGPSAGRTGFSRSYDRVYNRSVSADDVGVAALPHFVTANEDLVTQLLPPWIMSDRWPPHGPGGGGAAGRNER